VSRTGGPTSRPVAHTSACFLMSQASACVRAYLGRRAACDVRRRSGEGRARCERRGSEEYLPVGKAALWLDAVDAQVALRLVDKESVRLVAVEERPDMTQGGSSGGRVRANRTGIPGALRSRAELVRNLRAQGLSWP
jgi:hypothetical protein